MLLFGIVAGYLIGGIPTGIYLCRLVAGVDPRTTGSGSSGATNVSRVLGKQWAVVVLMVDALKGWLPVTLLPILLETAHGNPELTRIALAAGAVIGHVFTPYARFRGGKGVATSAGVMLAISPVLVGISLLIWLIVFSLKRVVSLASLAAFLTLPVAAFSISGIAHEVAWFSVALSLFIVLTHRENLARLLVRAEKPIL